MSYKNSHDTCSNLNDLQDSDFTRMIDDATQSRRDFLKSVTTFGLGSFLGLSPLAHAIRQETQSTLLGFKAVPASTADTVVVPEGYKAKVLISWGDPLFPNAPVFDPSGKSSASDQEKQFGDNTDGMTFFPINEKRGVLAVNNEYINPEYLFDHQGKAMTADNVKKSQAAHGVSIFEIHKKDKQWQVDKTGIYNRRITANTPMEITGPAAGHDLLKTSTDTSGKSVLGTFNNCANGETPWGTYLTCEENFHKYFGTQDKNVGLSPELKRYGIKPEDKRYQWSHFEKRFDFVKEPNEANRFGWVVEIDPFNPDHIPKKRTALGRFKHENAALIVDDSGHVVVYLGDDERGEHLYKFVSKEKYRIDDQTANRNLLDEGTLYVAKFSAEKGEIKGKGEWLELIHGKNGLTSKNGFRDQAEVLIKTRLAATQVGATTMDRPEWVAVHPSKHMAMCTLTNNKHRGKKENQPVGGPNPRENNKYGQIVRWIPPKGDHTTNHFDWDLYLIVGNPNIHTNNLKAGSKNINNDNLFNSPDGLGFDKDGRLWIQTDGKYSNTDDFVGMGNNQMLCSDPATGEVRRFLTGPIACEVTGLTFTPDYRTLFVGIQHPGEKLAKSHFPEGGNSKPRSSIMVITREDGGIIGT